MSFRKARPTVYRGIQMRSRLEARLAAEIDAAGQSWTYEPRAYAGLGGQYLPDFEVRTEDGRRFFMEVRPTVERAMWAFPQMQVILESEPDVTLVVIWPNPDGPGWGSFLSSRKDRTWRMPALDES